MEESDSPIVDCAVQQLTQHWEFSKFMPLQRDAINATVSGRDSLLLLPTGGAYHSPHPPL